MLLIVAIVVIILLTYHNKKENASFSDGNVIVNLTNGGDGIYLPTKINTEEDANKNFIISTVHEPSSAIYGNIINKFGNIWRNYDKPNKVVSTIPTVDQLIARQENR